PPQGDAAAAIGGRKGRRRCQPLPAHATGGARRPHLLPDARHARPAGWADLALPRGPRPLVARSRGADDLARGPRQSRSGRAVDDGASAARRGRPQAQFLSGMRPAYANYPRGALPRCSKSLAVASSSSASRRRWSEISGADSAKFLSSSALLRRKSIVSRIVLIQTRASHSEFRSTLFSISAACSSNSRANSSRFLATVLSVVWRAKRRQRAAFSR